MFGQSFGIFPILSRKKVSWCSFNFHVSDYECFQVFRTICSSYSANFHDLDHFSIGLVVSLFHPWELSIYRRKTLTISWGTNIFPTFYLFSPFVLCLVLFSMSNLLFILTIISLFFLVPEFWDICMPDDSKIILSIWVPTGSKWHTHIRIIQEGFSYKGTNLHGHGQVVGVSHRDPGARIGTEQPQKCHHPWTPEVRGQRSYLSQEGETAVQTRLPTDKHTCLLGSGLVEETRK